MAQVAIFLDGAYLLELSRREFRPRIRVDYGKLAGRIRDRIAEDTVEPLDILRTYYYDCPPFRSQQPTPDEMERYDGYQRFADALSHLPRFEVRLGWLQLQGRRPDGSQIFRQKQVDLLLGLDLALLSGKNRVSHVALVAGDGDFVPAVQAAKQEGATVWLFHGPRAGANGHPTYSRALYREADARAELDEAFLRSVERAS